MAADTTIRSHPDLAHTVSLLVAQHGEIVFERCYRDSGVADLHCAHSVTKSFISTIVGILAGDGLLSLDDRGHWNSDRVLNEGYVRTATSPLLEGGPPERCGYGLLWWVADSASPPHYFAGGYGGQYIMVVPELDLVAVTMGDADAMGRPPMGLVLRHLLCQQVVPAMVS